MMIHGNVFISSPTAQGYFGMPQSCRYERNHTVAAVFNATSEQVTMTIEATTSDLEDCTMDYGIQDTPGQRCAGGSCQPDLVGQRFYGIFRISKDVEVPAVEPFTADYQLDLTIHFPYKHQGSTGWSGYRQTIQDNFQFTRETLEPPITEMGTDFGEDGRGQVFMYSLATPKPWRPAAWFRDRKPYILSAFPNFGPEEGGPVVTIIGREFPEKPLGSLVLAHEGEGGQERECCETRRLSDTAVTCKLPRVSCLNELSAINACPKPGQLFENQRASYSIRPEVQGFEGDLLENELDDFLKYEGTYVLEDNDVYGGMYVPAADQIPGERHLLQQGQEQASKGGCCPVCPSEDIEGNPRGQCRVTITRSTTGVYSVSVPPFMSPGSETSSGVCDRATNYQNTSFLAAIERSTDPEGFTPPVPLSVTSCIDQNGPCKDVPRISIRETCKQLVWSTGQIKSELPVGQTVEVHEWITNKACDRRMRCIAGPCAWTALATTDQVLQRRTSSPQIGLQMDYKNALLDPQAFLGQLAPLIDASDPSRLQMLAFEEAKASGDVPVVLAADGGGREFEISDPVLCLPDEGLDSCPAFKIAIYIVSEGPEGAGFEVVLNNFTARAGAKTGDPKLRELNLRRICLDTTTDPEKVVAGIVTECIQIQYPGVLQFEVIDGSKDLRVKEEVWAYAKLGVTRTGGTDLGVTVDYRTYETDDPILLEGNATRLVEGPDGYFARGLGQDFISKVGQLRWIEGDARTKFIYIPIYSDGITEESETFTVRINAVVNATDITETATITIAGINNTPTPRYIYNMQKIIGAVCGAATAVPCALFAARLIRSLRRGSDAKKHRTVGKKEEAETAVEK